MTQFTYFWQAAAALAARAHRSQLRKDRETPYIAHPMRVALTVANVFGVTDDVTLAAALLHDTIEDTDTDYDDIAEACNREVADIVAALTKDARMYEPQREQAYDEQLARGPWQARLIKLADVYDNLQDTYSSESTARQLDKARRALKLAEGDDRLAAAREIVAKAVDALTSAG